MFWRLHIRIGDETFDDLISINLPFSHWRYSYIAKFNDFCSLGFIYTNVFAHKEKYDNIKISLTQKNDVSHT